MFTNTDDAGCVEESMAKSPTNPKFYRRDGRFLLSIDKDVDVRRDDYVEIAKSSGQLKLLKVQDEVIIGKGPQKKKRFFLFKDVTSLMNGGYIVGSMIQHYRQIDGTWAGIFDEADGTRTDD